MPIIPLGKTSADYAALPDHPTNNIPQATDHHAGTQLGIDRLSTQMSQDDAKAWMDVAGRDGRIIDSLVRGNTVGRGDEGE